MLATFAVALTWLLAAPCAQAIAVAQSSNTKNHSPRGGLSSWLPTDAPVQLIETAQRRPVADPAYQGIGATESLDDGAIAASMRLGQTLSVANALADVEIGPVLCQLYGGQTGPIPNGPDLEYARALLNRVEMAPGMGRGSFAVLSFAHAEAFLPGRPMFADWLLSLSQPPTGGMLQWMSSVDVVPLNQAGAAIAPLMQDAFVTEDLAWQLFNETLARYSTGRFNRAPSSPGGSLLIPPLRRQLRWAMSAVLPRRWFLSLPLRVNPSTDSPALSSESNMSDPTTGHSARWAAVAASSTSSRIWARAWLSQPNDGDEFGMNGWEMLPVLALGLSRQPDQAIIGPVVVPVLDAASSGWQAWLAQTQPHLGACDIDGCTNHSLGDDGPAALHVEAAMTPVFSPHPLASNGAGRDLRRTTAAPPLSSLPDASESLLAQHPEVDGPVWQRLRLANGTDVAVPLALVGLRVRNLGAPKRRNARPGEPTKLVRPAVLLAPRSLGLDAASVAERARGAASAACEGAGKGPSDRTCEGEATDEWKDHEGTRWWVQDGRFGGWGAGVEERVGGPCAIDIAATAGVPPGPPGDALSVDLVMSSSDTVYELPGGDAATAASRIGQPGGHGLSSDCTVLVLPIPPPSASMTVSGVTARALLADAGLLDASEVLFNRTTGPAPERVVAAVARVGQPIPQPIRKAARLLTAWKCSALSGSDDLSTHSTPLPGDVGNEPLCLSSERAALVLLRDAIGRQLARVRSAWAAAVDSGTFPSYDDATITEAARLSKHRVIGGTPAGSHARGAAVFAKAAPGAQTSMQLLLSARRALLAALQQVMLEWVQLMPAPNGA